MAHQELFDRLCRLTRYCTLLEGRSIKTQFYRPRDVLHADTPENLTSSAIYRLNPASLQIADFLREERCRLCHAQELRLSQVNARSAHSWIFWPHQRIQYIKLKSDYAESQAPNRARWPWRRFHAAKGTNSEPRASQRDLLRQKFCGVKRKVV